MLEVTETTIKQRKEAERKLANHYNAGNCEVMEKPQNNFSEVIEKEGYIFTLENIIENNSKACSKKHNSNIAVYKLFTGALGYDY